MRGAKLLGGEGGGGTRLGYTEQLTLQTCFLFPVNGSSLCTISPT